MSRKTFIAAIGLIAVALAATGAISASAANDDSSANHLVGSWQLTVDRGPTLPPVKGLTTYTSDGTLIGTGNTVLRGPAHGVWEHVSGRTYADTHIFFRFDSTGTLLGYPEDQRDRGTRAGRRLLHCGGDFRSVRSQRESHCQRTASDHHRDADQSRTNHTVGRARRRLATPRGPSPPYGNPSCWSGIGSNSTAL